MPHTQAPQAALDTRVRVAVDVGGTFTDVVLLRGETKHTVKVLTTPQAPELAVLSGVEEILRLAGLAWPQVELLILGTTLATNALIE
ncbi:MAG: hydantoinase/oxoprolinase N-terminal domain-containing protein, partial [Comamonas sp.]